MTLQELLRVPVLDDTPTFGVSFENIKKGQCKWPLNDIKPFEHFRMCGETTVDTLCPYCEAHERLAYQASNGRDQTREQSKGLSSGQQPAAARNAPGSERANTQRVAVLKRRAGFHVTGASRQGTANERAGARVAK